MSVVSLTLVHKQFIPNKFSIYFLSRSWSRAYALWDHQVTSVLEKADPCDLISPKYPSAWNGVAWVGNSSIKEKKKISLPAGGADPGCWLSIVFLFQLELWTERICLPPLGQWMAQLSLPSVAGSPAPWVPAVWGTLSFNFLPSGNKFSHSVPASVSWSPRLQGMELICSPGSVQGHSICNLQS